MIMQCIFYKCMILDYTSQTFLGRTGQFLCIKEQVHHYFNTFKNIDVHISLPNNRLLYSSWMMEQQMMEKKMLLCLSESLYGRMKQAQTSAMSFHKKILIILMILRQILMIWPILKFHCTLDSMFVILINIYNCIFFVVLYFSYPSHQGFTIGQSALYTILS